MKKLLFEFFLALLSLTAQANLVSAETRELNLLQTAQYLEDPTGRWGLEDVKGMSHGLRMAARGAVVPASTSPSA